MMLGLLTYKSNERVFFQMGKGNTVDAVFSNCTYISRCCMSMSYSISLMTIKATQVYRHLNKQRIGQLSVWYYM